MVEIYEKHYLKNWIRTKYQHVFLFMIVLHWVIIAYVVWVRRMVVISPAISMPLKSMKPQAKRTMSHENARTMIGISKVTLPFGKYITSTRTTAGIQYNLTNVTKGRTNYTPNMQRRSTEKLDLEVKKDRSRNRITSDYQKSHFITISLMGRLGNNMFQLAALISCANRLNYTAFLHPNTFINSYFFISRTNHIRLTNRKTFYEKMYAKYDIGIEKLDTSFNWTLSGYYESWKYFYKDEDLIRSLFEFRPNIYKPARQFVGSFREINKTIVGIHVRRGDMANQKNKMYGYTTAPLAYVNKSMNYFRDRYNDTFFIIISDEISWCQENIIGNNDTAFSNFDNPGIDMAILSFCDHVIITTGTFGWWGAWLAGGDVVYFKGFPRPGSRIDKGMCREDYYLPH